MAPSGGISARAGRPFITNGNTFYNDSSDDVSLAVFGVAKIKSVFLTFPISFWTIMLNVSS